MKTCSIFSSVSWVVGISPWSTMAQIPSWLLAVLLKHKGGTAYGLLEWRWVIPSVPEIIAFKNIYFIYLFILDREGREKERKRILHQCVVASCPPPTGTWLGPQPRHVPWLGIEQATLWFTGRCSIHWATPARANSFLHTLLTKLISYHLKLKFFQHLSPQSESEGWWLRWSQFLMQN